MIIEFPKKYSVEDFGAYCKVSVPVEYAADLEALLKAQSWASSVFPSMTGKGMFDVRLSRAYEVTTAQAIAALSQLCEYVMSPPVVMGDDLANDLCALLT